MRILYFDLAGTLVVQRGVVDRSRHDALVAQRLGGVDVSAAAADDHDVAGAQVLLRAVVDQAHALGHRHVLLAATGDARVALHARLGVAVDEIVVRGVLGGLDLGPEEGLQDGGHLGGVGVLEPVDLDLEQVVDLPVELADDVVDDGELLLVGGDQD